MKTLDWRQCFAPLLNTLAQEGQTDWADRLQQQLMTRFEERIHGDLARWQTALATLPKVEAVRADLRQSAIRLHADTALDDADRDALETGLRGLMPWRKGPFDFFGIHIDTEWHSDWKWERVAPHLSPLKSRRILDVGCGSGYHCWRMYGEGAARVVGVDPSLLFLMQFLAVKGYLGEVPVDLLPIRMEDLPERLGWFDTVFSMGVLYHRRSPLDHLQELMDALRPGGELVLETLVVKGDEGYALMPKDRYAMMRNVWFIPSCPTLSQWLGRLGFEDIRQVDLNQTSVDEQRSTDWMQFQSLADFLDPENPSRTIEGYPAPLRATFIARKPG
ncbi:tRNA 5-methoxyuridine(34)/uridine 5-oxyacetic acid(34) synthase CmoB [Mangrovitalea sediminis]|uniref:tRNA 5-methoxyuridine(34)/uridine 5-oxyacetic acid(34) synthase CmoB n=1 Tax=Mangrovitalea sediminis TaxID=1982043 RepID=UPI000BE5BC17|nr:tRNA 5-methoxyuridine(34)/uridine 5-oxyacetic acid(34) synthase CmoB [Mangrovitalea sediminis]